MTVIQNKKRFYNREKALGIAFELNSDEQSEFNDEVWRFIVQDSEHIDLSYIEVYDHENQFVGYWDL
jgi:hypothetical protein